MLINIGTRMSLSNLKYDMAASVAIIPNEQVNPKHLILKFVLG